MTNRSRARLLMPLIAVLGALSSAVGFGGTTTTAGAAGVSNPVPEMAISTYEDRVVYWINQKRDNHGLPNVRLESCTDNIAENWSDHLAATNTFYHQDLDKILNNCDAVYAGETLAKGPVTPKQLVTMWMNSPGHRAILLSTSPRRVGIGAQPDANGYWVVTADFARF